MKALPAIYEEIRWLVERTGYLPTAWARGLKAIDESGGIRGMIAYDNWTENSVQAHMAVDTPIAWRALLPIAFRLPFVEYNVGVVIGTVAANNARSLKLVRKFGFRELARVPDGLKPGVDLVIHTMRRSECRYLDRERQAA